MTNQITIPVTPTQHAALFEAARKAGFQTLAEYIRRERLSLPHGAETKQH
jgi:hypothetical protein